MMYSSLQKVSKVKGKTSSINIQTKLTIGSPNDKYEREADSMADRIMRMPQSFSNQPLSNGPKDIQRKCTNCENEEEHIQRKPLMMKSEGGTPEATQALGAQLNSTKGSGIPLPSGTNNFMSQAFGTDFSNVRIHTGGSAVQMNQGLNARAFTHGSDIYFNKGQYQPKSSEGKRLLGHELTHVVQQHKASSIVQRLADKSNPPSNLSCDRVDTGPGSPVGTHVVFRLGQQILDPESIELIAAEFRAWEARGRVDDITVDGFASSDGSSGVNWVHSCNRAETVKARFVLLGVPANMVTTTARGETEEFSVADPALNRRAVIRIVPTQQLNPSQGCPDTISENTTLTTACDHSITIAADNIVLNCAGNLITGNGGGSGILLDGRSGVRIVNCRVTNFRNGIGLRGNSSDNTFTNNTSFNNTADGFDLNDSPRNTFIQNIARNNPDHGFEFDFSGSNLLVGNTVSENGDGFDVSGINRRDRAPSPNNTFVNNIASNNVETGFRISSDGNTLRGNTANNSTGRARDDGSIRRGDGFRIEGNDNTISGNSGSGNQSDDLDVRNNTTGNTCSGNSFGTTNGQCPPEIP